MNEHYCTIHKIECIVHEFYKDRKPSWPVKKWVGHASEPSENTNLTITTIPAILKLFSDPKIPDYSDVQEGWLPMDTLYITYLKENAHEA